MAAYTKINGGENVLVKNANIASDSFSIALTNSVPGSTTFTAGTTDLATGNGYTAGGAAATTVSSASTSGTTKLILNSPATWTATGAVGPFRYALLVDSTVTTTLGYWDYGSSISLASGDTFAVTLDGTNGVFSVS